MKNFKYIRSVLHIDNKSILDLSKSYPTPFYLYSEETLVSNFQVFKDAATDACLDNSMVCFALKSNPNLRLLKSLAKLGSGADIVSGGELKRALKAGINPQRIVFSGVGKTEEEIIDALNCHSDGIYSFNVESIEELELINKTAKRLKKIARVAFRLNPQVQAKTHKHISTGYKTHKFGILKEDILKAIKKKSLWSHTKLCGLSIHIGSQLTCLKATKKAIKEMSQVAIEIGRPLEFVDVGGGLGVDYERDNNKPTPNDYMDIVASTLRTHFYRKAGYMPKVVFEPGRVICATAGLFITKVIRTKKSNDCFFAIVDGGMNDFVRTSLYGAYHEITPVKRSSSRPIKTDIVGPICETADCFATGVMLPKLREDNIICVSDTGAYGHSMSSTYNLRKRPNEITILSSGELHITKY